MQMGVKYDRVLDAFDGPFSPVTRLLAPPGANISGVENPASYCMGHETNDVFVAVNRLLKAAQDVLWMQADQAFCTPASEASREVLARAAAELGVPVKAVAIAPAGAALKLKPVRIGLYDQYGGLAPSGWTRWLLEQFEFPYEVVYPQTLNAGGLRDKFDVLLFPNEAYRTGSRGSAQPRPETIPAEFRGWLGRITPEDTAPQIKRFAEAGGTVLTIGSSTGLATQ